MFSIVDTRKVYDWVFGIYTPIAVGVIVLFTSLIVGAVLVYRRNTEVSRRHEANALEAAYALVLTCVAAFLLYVTFTAEHRVDTASARERPAITVDVTGSRWEWTFSYPGHGITHESGAVGDQPLVVPANEPVRFRISSADVIHSLWIPQLRFKRDAIPGSTQTVTLDFDRTGHFSGSCAEFCGLLHADMVFTASVITPRAFRSWLASDGRART
ncbi:MAG TPA: cytochrome c oxidase subunit II [Solirubrobacteraceae bacterium]|nr:cytochrome c oxidase subunit II [Solirubrobacteraceae bacterium]